MKRVTVDRPGQRGAEGKDCQKHCVRVRRDGDEMRCDGACVGRAEQSEFIFGLQAAEGREGGGIVPSAVASRVDSRSGRCKCIHTHTCNYAHMHTCTHAHRHTGIQTYRHAVRRR